MNRVLGDVLSPWWADIRRRRQLLGAARTAGPLLCALLWTVNVARTVLPTLTGLVTGLLVSRLVSAPHDRSTLVLLVMAVCSLVLATQAVDAIGSVLGFSVSRRVDSWHRSRLVELMARPQGIEHLEDPAVQEDLASAVLKGLPGWVSYTFGTAAVGQITIVARTMGACIAAAVLARFSWELAVSLLLVVQFTRLSSRREWLAQHAVVRELASATRRANYWADVSTMPWAAKELRVFGLTAWAIGRFRALMTARTARMAAVRWRLLRRTNRMFVLLTVSVAGGLGVLAAAAASGRISTGSLAVYLGAFWGVVAANGMDVESFDVEFAGLPTLAAVDRLRARVGGPAIEGIAGAPGDARPPVVRFETVEFHYPDSSRPVLNGFDLEITPGELIALVGVNGAGKTTLTKLLTGMYQPTGGRITVDGQALSTLELSAWHEQIAVVLQEFVHYDLSIRDNVVLGAPRRDTAPSLLESVARQAGITDLVQRAPLGWDTPLARAYSEGIELSGGQWQRIALARALYAVAQGARLLVLDEPTAHLDVRAELDTFTRIADAARGASVLLISHRLSTVRRADKIVLLDGGRVVEMGRHDELVARGGAYAQMFAAQADRFGDLDLDIEAAAP
ncbi:ABC transporter ATP-binding protein [Kitasatospora kifunensis]|uniref:ABC transporter ATP-binding protein n=1 Tax=Kitasatospora kifunensis TaxID=58351 RepID=UPI0028ABA842|nr:ABC transporter ATP-binding protein [Kitasatospora kifunensis]